MVFFLGSQPCSQRTNKGEVAGSVKAKDERSAMNLYSSPVELIGCVLFNTVISPFKLICEEDIKKTKKHVMTEEHDWLMGSVKDDPHFHPSRSFFLFLTVNTKRTTLETGLTESQSFILRTFWKARKGQNSLITNDR